MIALRVAVVAAFAAFFGPLAAVLVLVVGVVYALVRKGKPLPPPSPTEAEMVRRQRLLRRMDDLGI